jgi:hypothetical protein
MKLITTVLLASTLIITNNSLSMLTKTILSTTKPGNIRSYQLPTKNIFNTKKATTHEQKKLLADLNDRNDSIICDLEFEKLHIQESINRLQAQQNHATNVINGKESLDRDFLNFTEAQLMINKVTHTRSILLTE